MNLNKEMMNEFSGKVAVITGGEKSSYITGIDLVVDGGMTSIYIEDRN